MSYNYNYSGPGPFDQEQGKQNETVYNSKPIVGGENKIVVNETIVRQVPRTSPRIEDWRSSHSAAESRYYPLRTRLYNIYDEILLDGHLSGIISKRLNTV